MPYQEEHENQPLTDAEPMEPQEPRKQYKFIISISITYILQQYILLLINFALILFISPLFSLYK